MADALEIRHPGSYALVMRIADGALFRYDAEGIGTKIPEAQAGAVDKMRAELFELGFAVIPYAIMPPHGLLLPAFWQLPIWRPEVRLNPLDAASVIAGLCGGVLSEGQAAKALGIERVDVRAMQDDVLERAEEVWQAVKDQADQT